MEMCYDGALTMPSSFIVVEENEMEYIDGGWSWKTFEQNMVGLAVVGAAVGFLGKQVLKICAANHVLSAVVAKASAVIARIGSFFGGWIGAVVFATSAAAAIYYLGNHKVWSY